MAATASKARARKPVEDDVDPLSDEEPDSTEVAHIKRTLRDKSTQAVKNLKDAEAALGAGMPGLGKLLGERIKGLWGFILMVALPTSTGIIKACGGFFNTPQGQAVADSFVQKTSSLRHVLTDDNVINRKPTTKGTALEPPCNFRRRWYRRAWHEIEIFFQQKFYGWQAAATAAEGLQQGGEGAGERAAVGEGEPAAEVGEGEQAAEQAAAVGEGEQGTAGNGIAVQRAPTEVATWGTWSHGLCNGGKKPEQKGEYKIWVVGDDGLCKCGGSCKLYRAVLGLAPTTPLIAWGGEDFYACQHDADELIRLACKLSPYYRSDYQEAKDDRAKDEKRLAKERGKLAASSQMRRAQADVAEPDPLEAGSNDDDAAGAAGDYDDARLVAVFEKYNQGTQVKCFTLLLKELGGTKAKLSAKIDALQLRFKRPTDGQVSEMCRLYKDVRAQGRSNKAALPEIVKATAGPCGAWSEAVVKAALKAGHAFVKDKAGPKRAGGKSPSSSTITGDGTFSNTAVSGSQASGSVSRGGVAEDGVVDQRAGAAAAGGQRGHLKRAAKGANMPGMVAALKGAV